MTRSNFDPTNPQVQRSGSRFTGPDAANSSKMPPELVDAEANEDEGGHVKSDLEQAVEQHRESQARRKNP